MALIDLHNERMNLVKQMRDILDRAETEKRSISAEEQQQYDTMETRFDQIQSEIDKRTKLETRERSANVPINPMPGDGGEKRGDADKKKEMETRAFNRYLKFGGASLEQEHRQALEKRALQVDADIYGGYLVSPEAFSARLIQKVDDLVIMRQISYVEPLISADSLGIASLDADPADAEWTAEIKTGGEDSTMAFGKRDLHPHPLAKRIKVSDTLLRRSTRNVEDIVIQRLGYKFSVTHENAFLNGSGSNQPLGVFTSSSNGIPATRDVATGNTTTTIGADGLIDALYSLKEGYMRNARWIFHRLAIKQIRKLKDSDGQYLWQPGLAADKPAVILERPYHMSEYAPSTFTAGLYVGIVGDFQFYNIVDSLAFQIKRLVELYAETNQVGFIGRLETDGMPVLAEAFARVKLAL